MTPKQQRANAIAQCVLALADFTGAAPSEIITEAPRKKTSVKKACYLLAFHLHKCGMSYQSIGRVLMRSTETAQDYEFEGALCMVNDQDRRFLKRLPKIPTTLQITQAAS